MQNRKVTTIVTAANEGFSDFLSGWVGCMLHHEMQRHASLVVFDCGLAEATRRRLEERDIDVRPAPHYKITVDGVPSYYRAMTLRPSLPTLLDGSEFYVWLDADCWLQDATAVEDLVTATKNRSLACCVEIDRSYSCHSEANLQAPFDFGHGARDVSLFEQWTTFYERFYGHELSRRLAAYPLINAGVFCARHDSAIWQAWDTELEKLFAALAERKLSPDPFLRRLDLLADQTALNAAVRMGDMEIAQLPSTYNWMCHRALPLLDEERSCFTERFWPYEPLKIIHLTTADVKKSSTFAIPTLKSTKDGGTPKAVSRSLRSPHAFSL